MPTPPRPPASPGRSQPFPSPSPLPDVTAIRLRAVPDCAPPFDDERPDDRSALNGPPFDFGDRGTVEAEPSATVRHGSVAGRPPARFAPDPTAVDGRVTGSGSLREWAGRFAQALAETVAGVRPASQVVSCTTQRARSQIRRLGPLLAAEQTPRVSRLLACRPADDVVEMTAVVRFGPRTRVLAARLQRVDGRPATPGRPARPARWLCTDVESA